MKNTHLEHPEDLILTGNLDVIESLYSVADISLKIDGAPSIVWGFHPHNGRFFVGTKSVFNKKKIKICYSKDDVFSLYNHTTHENVINILCACLEYIPRQEGIYQGDFIGFGGSSTYTPNTLKYDFGTKVRNTIIIAPHTQYIIEGEMCDAEAYPLDVHFVDTPDVKWVQPTVDRILVKNAPMSINISKMQFLTPSEASVAKQSINKLIREGEDISDLDLTDILGCPYLANLYQLVIEIKKEVMESFIIYGTPKCYLPNGYKVAGEGFVLSNEFGMFKLVDRPTFAYANMNQGRFVK